MPSGKELIRINSVAHLINQLAAGALAGQPNAAGTAAAQQVTAAEEGIQGGLAQGKAKAMQEEADKAKKKGLLKKVVSTVVGTAASAIPVAGPIVGPMIGSAAGSLASGQPIDPLEVSLSGVGGIPGTIEQNAIRNPASPQGTMTPQNSSYDPTTGGFVPQQPASQVPATPTAPPQPVAAPAAPPQATTTPGPASPSAPPVDAGQQQAVQAASNAIALPPAPAQTPVGTPPAPPALPQAAPPAAPTNVHPQGLGQRIASALTSEQGQSVTGAIRQYLEASQASPEVPSVYAPGLNPQTSLAIDQQFAQRAEADAQRAIQEEQLGLQREGLGLDKSKLALDKERLAQEGAAQQAQQVLEQGKLGLSTYEAEANAAFRKDSLNTDVYKIQASAAIESAGLQSREKIAAAGDATQLKAAGISAGATLGAAKMNREAIATEARLNREFNAAMSNVTSKKTAFTPTGDILVTGMEIDPVTMKSSPTQELITNTPEVQAAVKNMMLDERLSAHAGDIVTEARVMATDKMTGEVNKDRFQAALPTVMESYRKLIGAPSPDKPQATTSQADIEGQKRTEANDNKLKAIKSQQVATTPTAAQPAPVAEKPNTDDVSRFLLDPLTGAAIPKGDKVGGNLSSLVSNYLSPTGQTGNTNVISSLLGELRKIPTNK